MTDTPKVTLRKIWQTVILPQIDEISARTREEYEAILRLWERYTSNPDISLITKEMVIAFRHKLITIPFRRGVSTKGVRKRASTTVNRLMRDLHVIVSWLWPADRSNPSGLNKIKFFKFPRALSIQRKLPFVFSSADLNSLYLHAGAARPNCGRRATTKQDPGFWRLALVLGVNCGARTWDLFALNKSDVVLAREGHFRYGYVTFTAKKTGKLHRIPLTRCSALHVKAILGHPEVKKSDRLFPGFAKTEGFYNSWERICAAANVTGTFESMRKTCATRHNDIIWQAGFWITGHIQSGVFGHYDNPSGRIFKAVYKHRQPKEFVAAAKRLAEAAS